MRLGVLLIGLLACGSNEPASPDAGSVIDSGRDTGLVEMDSGGPDAPPAQDAEPDAPEDAASVEDAGMDSALPNGPVFSCESPGLIQVPPGGWARVGSTTLGVPLSFGCGSSDVCPNHFWAFSLAERRRLRVRLEPGFDGVVGLYGDPCGPESELECYDEMLVGAEGWVGEYDAGDYFISVGGVAEPCMNNYIVSLSVSTDFPSAAATTSAGTFDDGSLMFGSMGDFIEEEIEINQPSVGQVRLYFEVDRQGCAPELEVSISGEVFGTIQVPEGDGVILLEEKRSDGTHRGDATLLVRLESLTACESGGWSILAGGQLITQF